VEIASTAASRAVTVAGALPRAFLRGLGPSSGAVADGPGFQGLSGLRKVLLAGRDQFVNTVAEKLLMYALGRNLQYYAQPAVRAIVHRGATGNFTPASLVAGVVKSPQFQMRAR